jgi:hypothetical protein
MAMYFSAGSGDVIGELLDEALVTPEGCIKVDRVTICSLDSVASTSHCLDSLAVYYVS